MRVVRKSFLATGGAFAAIGIVRFPAGAAEFTYKLSTENRPDYYMTKRLLEAAAGIKRDSNGRFEIQIFPNSQLGSSGSVLEQVRAGALQMATCGWNQLSDVVPVTGIPILPFVFPSAKEGYVAMAGPLGKYLYAAIVKTTGLYVFARCWGDGFRELINNRGPITAPEDMKGLKLRVPAVRMLTTMFQDLGASPTPLDFAQVYTALQTHLVDGLELALGSVEIFKIYEVQKYVSYTNHIWQLWSIVCNGEAWRRLPKDIQAMADRYVNRAQMLAQEDVAAGDASLEATLKSQGMMFNKANIEAFRSTLQKAGFYGQYHQTYGDEAWGLLEKAVGRLG